MDDVAHCGAIIGRRGLVGGFEPLIAHLFSAAVYIFDLNVIALTRCGARWQAKPTLYQDGELTPLVIAKSNPLDGITLRALCAVISTGQGSSHHSAGGPCPMV